MSRPRMAAAPWRSLAGLLLACTTVSLGLRVEAARPQERAEDRDAERAERLKQMSLEELMELQVTSASKFPQLASEVPAAIRVIRQDELRRAGVRTLPEALRLATGLHVARFDSRTWAISARGLNSQTANKLLVLIDGRSVYTPLFSGVFWDVQNYLIRDIDRIEVIRGPGAAVWGSNAVNGVVNVVTKSAAETQGGLAVAGAGTEHRGFGELRWGGGIGDAGPLGNGHYRVYGKAESRDGLVFSDGRDARDDLRFGQGGFRADFAPGADTRVTLQGDLYGGEIGHPTLDDTEVDGGNLGVRWERDLSERSDVQVHAYYDRTYRKVPAQFEETRSTVDLNAQHYWRGRRHELVWGGAYRSSRDRVTDSPIFDWEPNRRTVWIASLFVQDQIVLAPEWRLTLGARVEDQSTMDLELQPSLRLAWAPGANELLWAAVSRAVRAPTRIDRDVRVPGEPPFVVVGSRDFEPEEVIAYELGYRYLPRTDLVFGVNAFYNDYDELRSQEPTPGAPGGLPLVLGNRLEAETYGVELSGRLDVSPRVHLFTGLTWLETDLHLEPGSGDPTGGAPEANDPDFHGFLRLDLDLARGFELGATLRHVGALPAPEIPAYTELDLRLGWRPRQRLELAVVGQNLLDGHHPEFGNPTSREEVERGIYGEVVWHF
jgi:iron complex outermembrane recepter protein